MRSDAGDNGVEDRADSILHGDGGEALGHFAFDLARGILFLCTVCGDCCELIIRVRIGLAREHGLDQALGHDVRKSAVGSGRVSVVLNRKTEVARRGIARAFEDVFSGAD